jgi:flagellar hook-basal body complex protein FliE
MPIVPIDPSMAAMGADWQVPGISGVEGQTGAGQSSGAIDGAAGSTGKPGESFGQMLAGQVDSLQTQQVNAAQQSQALAAGEATDPSQVVMAVERARLSMQLASQIRTKLVEAQQDIFHTQV